MLNDSKSRAELVSELGRIKHEHRELKQKLSGTDNTAFFGHAGVLQTLMIFEKCPMLIYIYDLVSDSVVYSNRELPEMLGYSPSDAGRMRTKPFDHLVHKQDLTALAEHHARLACTGDSEAQTARFRVRQQDGSWVRIQSRDVPFTRGSDGSVKEILGCIQAESEITATEPDGMKSSSTHLHAIQGEAEASAPGSSKPGNATALANRIEKLERLVQMMAGREKRVAALKRTVEDLRAQMKNEGIEPIVDDPLRTPAESSDNDEASGGFSAAGDLRIAAE
jgi:PAS domain S-box-containing protein